MFRLTLLFVAFSSFLTNPKFSAVGTCLAGEDLLIEDFESKTYGDWTVDGNAFGTAPASGTLPNQHSVEGFRGRGLVNTFFDGDATTGTATSPPFTIQKPHIAFLIGGGPHEETVGIELLVNGKRVRHETGPASEQLVWESWSVKEFRGETAQVRIYDHATGDWGHINIDHIVQTDTPPARFDLSDKLTTYRKSQDYLNEPSRPQFHFSPEINWMNDPNGLVFHRGEYHLFYQFNPLGNSWGHMSWGHAVSKDLVHWSHLPIAIAEDDGIMAFSGCCVVDHKNTTGFGTTKNPPMVAVYTGHTATKQIQNLAYSVDNGRTWTKYAENPVLDLNERDFRDPKVFWHASTDRWVMVVSLAAERRLLFFGSKDLKTWEKLSEFGPAGTRTKSNWECPDLFQLPVENSPGKTLWVLETDMGAGAIAGGSGGEYFVGEFDGQEFKAIQHAQWVDYGRDFYAPISWNNLPQEDGRTIWLGWFNNWETCLLPTSPWRSAMSVPRTLSLKRVAFNKEEPETYVLIQRPVRELNTLRSETLEIRDRLVSWPPTALTKPGQVKDMSFELEATLHTANLRSIGFRIRTGENEFTEIGYDRDQQGVYLDRSHSGEVSFHAAFAGRHSAPARIIDGAVQLRVLVDRSSVEVFINDGEAVLSDRIFPKGNSPVIEAFAGEGQGSVTKLKLHDLQSIWHDRAKETELPTGS